MTEELAHEGVLRKSGRYPWGSGENPNQRNATFLSTVDELKKKGLTEAQIAEGMGITTTQLRARRTIATNEKLKADQATANRLRLDKGMSNVAIGKEMGINESSVRALLDPARQERANILMAVSDRLKDAVDKNGLVDIGEGIESHMGVSKEKLAAAIAILKEKDYPTYNFQVEQLGTGKKTTVKVIAPPGTEYRDVYANQDKIHSIADYTPDGGRTWTALQPPKNLDSKRVMVRYAEDGGINKDGVIELRRGVEDLSLGASRYAQVRVAVDGTHYLKGMAMYADDMPDGVDVIFNTNKSDTGNKLNALKPLKDDPENPFGAVIKPGGQRGVLNIVNEEGDWEKWSRNLSSQMLSKQTPSLAKRQLDLKFKSQQDEFEEIMALTNPTVKKKLLQTFADSADSSAVHLKAASLPRQGTHAILPINSIKDNEIYAPNYNNGEKVVLIRYPHGGIFEIPELTVNNKNAEAKSILSDRQRGTARDAVGIHSKVAERLSGADFDGDTVLVIPNNSGAVKTASPLAGLKNFDSKRDYAFPKEAYSKLEPGTKMFKGNTQQLMGDISNLITDMTIKGAPHNEIARAVRHSMVVIDAEKHDLNYKQSAIDNNIKELKTKYQGSGRSGASTLVSLASSEARVNKRKARPAKEGGGIDPLTGKKVFVDTGETYTKVTVNEKTGEVKTSVEFKKEKSTKMAEAENAFDLSSGTPMENLYAEHANKLKALANMARKSYLETPSSKYNGSANKVYETEVKQLQAKLNTALKNKPLERQAQLIANAQVKLKTQANPNMEKDDLKKLRNQELNRARERTGAKKVSIAVTDKEWEAIQAGAISAHKLEQILANIKDEEIKRLATPRTSVGLTPTKVARVKAMMSSGYSQSEIADALGVSTSAITEALD